MICVQNLDGNDTLQTEFNSFIDATAATFAEVFEKAIVLIYYSIDTKETQERFLLL